MSILAHYLRFTPLLLRVALARLLDLIGDSSKAHEVFTKSRDFHGKSLISNKVYSIQRPWPDL